MRRGELDQMRERVAVSLPGASCRSLYDGPKGYLLRGVTVEGRAFEIQRASDLKRIAPKHSRTKKEMAGA